MDRFKNLIDKVTGLPEKVPGYTGYKDKETRRDEDKRLRDTVADQVNTAHQTLTRYSADLSSNRELDSISRVEDVIGQMRLLEDRIRTASYGYGGLFGNRNVDATALDQLRMFDLALQREVGSLGTHVDDVVNDQPPTSEDLRSLNDDVHRLQRLFDGRGNVVSTGQATRDEQVLGLLSIDEERVPSALLSVKRGEAVSVLGDNYVVNGVMNLSSPEGSITLLRVSETQDGATWLMGSSIDAIPSAKLTEQGSGNVGFGTMQSASASIETEKGRESDIAARYAVRPADNGEVELTIVLGDVATTYRGPEINDLDVETYGSI